MLLSGNCSWNAHVDHVVGKTAVALNYTQRNLIPANSNHRNIVHLRGIRPILECACTLWDPSQVCLIDKGQGTLEMDGQYSCTEMKKELNWEPLSFPKKKIMVKAFIPNIQ